MPINWSLPNPLSSSLENNKTNITTLETWHNKRSWIKDQFTHWFFGTTPPPPQNLTWDITSETKHNRSTNTSIHLHFGPDNKASLEIEIISPDGEGPFPVFLTQFDHRGWGLLAVQHGYMAVLYAACDSADDTDSFNIAYPDYDWSLITKRAWAASRVID